MSRCKIRVSLSAILLLALFVLFSSPILLAALLLAALCHELGHYVVLHAMGGIVKEINLTASGAEMQVKSRVGYGKEFLITLAGPGINLLLAWCLSLLGRQMPIFYLFSGAQAVLGGFNLLPMHPLDGGTMLWTAVAYFWGPYAADQAVRCVGLAVALCLTAFAVFLFGRMGGTPFFLLSALGLLWYAVREIGLVKRPRKR